VEPGGGGTRVPLCSFVNANKSCRDRPYVKRAGTVDRSWTRRVAATPSDIVLAEKWRRCQRGIGAAPSPELGREVALQLHLQHAQLGARKQQPYGRVWGLRASTCAMAVTPQVAAASASALRVLCLHGYVQNASIFRQRTGSLRKALSSRVKEFVFIDAPHDARGAFPEGVSEAERGEPQQPPSEGDDVRGWWTSGENVDAAATPGQWVRPSQSRRAVGMDESLALLVDTLVKEGPFDGILGFSQGAAMGALLLAHVQQALQNGGSLSGLTLPRFAILVAGFVPMDDRLQSLMKNSSVIASGVAVLCVSGTEDALVPPARVQTLADCFGGRVQVFSHPGGHGIPSNAAFRTAVRTFLDEHAQCA
jgi:hypothetical protein